MSCIHGWSCGCFDYSETCEVGYMWKLTSFSWNFQNHTSILALDHSLEDYAAGMDIFTYTVWRMSWSDNFLVWVHKTSWTPVRLPVKPFPVLQCTVDSDIFTTKLSTFGRLQRNFRCSKIHATSIHFTLPIYLLSTHYPFILWSKVEFCPPLLLRKGMVWFFMKFCHNPLLCYHIATGTVQNAWGSSMESLHDVFKM
jgi:hypothetical protein